MGQVTGFRGLERPEPTPEDAFTDRPPSRFPASGYTPAPFWPLGSVRPPCEHQNDQILIRIRPAHWSHGAAVREDTVVQHRPPVIIVRRRPA